MGFWQGKQPEMRDRFSATEASSVSGVPYKTVDYWAKTGFIVPSIAAARGSGTERRYSFDDLVALRVARQLRKEGASMQALRKVVTALRNYKTDFASSRLIVVGSDIALVEDHKRV